MARRRRKGAIGQAEARSDIRCAGQNQSWTDCQFLLVGLRTAMANSSTGLLTKSNAVNLLYNSRRPPERFQTKRRLFAKAGPNFVALNHSSAKLLRQSAGILRDEILSLSFGGWTHAKKFKCEVRELTEANKVLKPAPIFFAEEQGTSLCE